MAVSVNKVYQTVLRLCNKEKRGFLTPKEFNLFADTAQMDIFEQYFFDLSQHQRRPGNFTEHSDPRDIIEDKIAYFKIWTNSVNAGVSDNFGNVDVSATLPDIYRITGVRVRYNPTVNPDYIIAEELDGDRDYFLYGNTKKATFNTKYPIFVKHSDNNSQFKIKIRPFPDPTQDEIRINYIRRPKRPKWTYVVYADRPYYNATATDHQDFELHSSEYNNLVNKILMMAGVTIGNQAIAQAAASEDVKSIQQEKL